MNSTCMWCLGLSLLPSILSFSQDFLTHPANGVAFPEEEISVIRIECGEAIDWMLTEENWYSTGRFPIEREYIQSCCEEVLQGRV